MPPEAAAAVPADDLGRTRSTAIIAETLVQGIGFLRWPSLALLVVPVVPLLAGLWVLTRIGGLGFWVLLVVLLAAGAVVVLFALRRRRYLEAVSDEAELARQLRSLLEPSLVTDEAVDLVGQVVDLGGWRLLRRLKAVWSLLNFTDHVIGTTERYDRARWFCPANPRHERAVGDRPVVAGAGVLAGDRPGGGAGSDWGHRQLTRTRRERGLSADPQRPRPTLSRAHAGCRWLTCSTGCCRCWSF